MPRSNEGSGQETSFRSDAEMLAVVTRRAEQQVADRRRRQRLVTGGIAALVVVLLGVSAFAVIRDDGGTAPAQQVDTGGPRASTGPDPTVFASPPEQPDTTVVADDIGPRPENLVDGGAWTALARSPLSSRVNAVSAWTGTELLVWGGEGSTTDTCGPQEDGSSLCGDPVRGDGAAYDPVADSWRPMADGPLTPDLGSSFEVRGAWTGSELVVWGGRRAQGAAYNPTTDSWRTIAKAPIEWRSRFGAVWTGDEVVIAGGARWEPSDDPSSFGGQKQVMPVEIFAYAPDADTWRQLPDLPHGRVDPVLATVDGQVVVLGGYGQQVDPAGNKTGPSVLMLDGEKWMDLGDPLVGRVTAAVGAGDRLVVSGITDYDPASTEPVAAMYDPDDRVWERLADPADRVQGWKLLWTGTDVLLLPSSEIGMGDGPLTIQVIDPEGGNRWRSLPPLGPYTVQGAAVAWTGSDLVFWGGAILGGYGNELRDVSGRYSPG